MNSVALPPLPVHFTSCAPSAPPPQAPLLLILQLSEVRPSGKQVPKWKQKCRRFAKETPVKDKERRSREPSEQNKGLTLVKRQRKKGLDKKSLKPKREKGSLLRCGWECKLVQTL